MLIFVKTSIKTLAVTEINVIQLDPSHPTTMAQLHMTQVVLLGTFLIFGTAAKSLRQLPPAPTGNLPGPPAGGSLPQPPSGIPTAPTPDNPSVGTSTAAPEESSPQSIPSGDKVKRQLAPPNVPSGSPNLPSGSSPSNIPPGSSPPNLPSGSSSNLPSGASPNLPSGSQPNLPAPNEGQGSSEGPSSAGAGAVSDPTTTNLPTDVQAF